MAVKPSATDLSIIPVGVHTYSTAVDAGVVTVTIPSGASGILIQCTGANVRFTLDGTDPVFANTGFLLETADDVVRIDLYPGARIKMLGTTSSAVNYQFYKPVKAIG